MAGRLTVAKIEDLFPDIGRESITIHEYGYHSVNMPLQDLAPLCRLVKHLRPRVIFEIGTYAGNTTLQLAVNSEAEVYTLDLPPGGTRLFLDPELDVYPVQVGQCFRNSPWAGRIHQLLGDSQTFDFSPWYGKVDLVFVDGCHHYDFVQQDSQNALKLLAPSGVILWHDYAAWAPGVMRVVEELADALSPMQLADTNLAVCNPDGQRLSRKHLEQVGKSESATAHDVQRPAEKLQARAEDLEVSHNALMEGNQLLESSLAEAQAAYRELQHKYEELGASCNALLEGNKVLEANLGSAQHAYRELQTRYEQLGESCNVLQDGNTSLESSLAEAQASYRQLQEKYEELGANCNALLEGNKALEASLRDWQASHHDLESKDEELGASCEALLEGNRLLESSLMEWQASHRELQARYNALRASAAPKTRRVF